MTLTNAYVTLPQLKDWMTRAAIYGAATLSFTASTKTIADSALGLKKFPTGARITISGSVSNNSTFTVATGGVAGSLVVAETLVNEAAGATVTITDVSDPMDDSKLEGVINAVSRELDRMCAREFYQAGTLLSPTTRYYTPFDTGTVYIDDFVSVSELATDDLGDRTYATVWQAADFDLRPDNAAAKSRPYTWIEMTPNGAKSFPLVRKGVRLKGIAGWPAIPPEVVTASLIQCGRIGRRGDAPFGVIGSAEMGQLLVIPKLDPDVALLLEGLKRRLV